MNLSGNNPLNSLLPNLIWKWAEGWEKTRHFSIQNRNKLGRRYLWNDHMLHSISIKTMRLQYALITWHFRKKEAEEEMHAWTSSLFAWTQIKKEETIYLYTRGGKDMYIFREINALIKSKDSCQNRRKGKTWKFVRCRRHGSSPETTTTSPTISTKRGQEKAFRQTLWHFSWSWKEGHYSSPVSWSFVFVRHLKSSVKAPSFPWRSETDSHKRSASPHTHTMERTHFLPGSLTAPTASDGVKKNASLQSQSETQRVGYTHINPAVLRGCEVFIRWFPPDVIGFLSLFLAEIYF